MRFQPYPHFWTFSKRSKQPSPSRATLFISIFLILLLSGLFYGCGDGGSDGDVNQISGTVSDGAPIRGEIHVRDAEGEIRTATIDADGVFSMDTSGLVRPYLLWAESLDTGNRYYGMADFQGRANLTPVGHAAVAMALGIDPGLYYDSLPHAEPPPREAVSDAGERLTGILSPAFGDLNIPEGFDVLHDPFPSDDTGFDRLLELITVSISDPWLRLRNTFAGVPFFSYDLLTGAVTGWEPEVRRRIILEADCSVDFQNWYVHTLMEEIYLWKDEMPDVNPDDYDSPAALLRDMIAPEKDHFSFIGPADEVGLFLEEGVYLGLGVKIRSDLEGLRFGLVYPDSPAYLAGLQRGDRLMAVNGRDVSEPGVIGEELDFTQPGQTARLTVETLEGDVVELSLAADWVVTDPVFHYDILEVDGRRVGYLVFNDFLRKSMNEIDAAFAYFKAGGIDELVLDLRYNPGGAPDVAVRLAGWIAGDKVDGADVFSEMIHNEGYADADRTIFFEPNDNAPALDRVAIVTGPRTASAGEMLINGLAPFMEVILVGETTYGKPVGMYVYDLCDKLFMPAAFRMINALGEGAFFDGIPPDCPADDDLDHALGDPDEASLSAALYYLANGSCPPEGPAVRMRAEFGPADIPLSGFRRLIGGF